jgi:hypothetical protein
MVMSPHPCCSAFAWLAADRCGTTVLHSGPSCSNHPTERQTIGSGAGDARGDQSAEHPNESSHSMSTSRISGASIETPSRFPALGFCPRLAKDVSRNALYFSGTLFAPKQLSGLMCDWFGWMRTFISLHELFTSIAPILRGSSMVGPIKNKRNAPVLMTLTHP